MDPTRLVLLDNALQRIASSACSFSGETFRITVPLYANKIDALSGEGSRKASGRFHENGRFLIVYTGCSRRQAEWENRSIARKAGLSVDDLLPQTTFRIKVNLSKVLDLTDSRVRRSLEVTKKEIVSGNWDDTSKGEPLTHGIGRLAHKYGFEAILAPSQGPDNNLNLLPENRLPTSLVQLVNEDRLPPR